MRSKEIAVVLVATIATSFSSACDGAAERKRAEARATQLRSAETAPRERVIGENGDAFAKVRREQLELRARVHHEIEDVDRRLAALKVELRDGGYAVDPRSANNPRVRELLERRVRLADAATALERADERGWDELKRAIERDLRT